jgi:hypothetical protein
MATAVLQLLYTETTTVEWLFHQEKATLHELNQCTLIGEPLYRVVYSLAEVNPAFQQAPVIVADTLDGKPLAGNFQIVVTGEKGQSRWVRNLLAIHVMTVE